MVSKFKLIKSILFSNFNKKDPVKQASAEESVQVRALKRQVSTLEEINEAYAEQVKLMSKELSKHREGDMQEKIINLAMEYIVPKSNGPKTSSIGAIGNQNIEQQTKLESGIRYSDDKLISVAQSLPPTIIQQLQKMSMDKFSEIIKSQIPNISDESIKRSRDIIESFVT